MKYLKEFLIAVLIVGLFASGYLNHRQKTEYQNRETVLKAKYDSLNGVQQRTDLEAIKALTQLNVARQMLADQSKVTEKYKLRYEAFKRISPAKLSDVQIDSAVKRLYPIR